MKIDSFETVVDVVAVVAVVDAVAVMSRMETLNRFWFRPALKSVGRLLTKNRYEQTLLETSNGH